MAADSSSSLERGRHAYEEMLWSTAFEQLTIADEGGGLEGGDLELYATTAYMLGRVELMLGLLERAHKSYLAAGEVMRAARSAVWLASNLAAYRKIGPATGWLKRAEQLLEDRDEESEVQGYLLLPVLSRHEMAEEFEEVIAVSKQAAAIGRRFDDSDLVALADQMHGRSLLRLGRIGEGLVVLDTAMVSVVGGNLSPQVTGIVYCSVIEGCYEVQEIRRSREWTAALSNWCDRQPDLVAFTDQCFAHRAEIRRFEGRWDEALEEARKSHGRNARGLVAAQAFYQEAEVHRLRGEYELAESAYKKVSQRGSDPHPGLALLRLAQGDIEAAAAAARRALDEAQATFERARLLPAYIEIMLAGGDLEAAETGCRDFEAIAAGTGTDVHHAASSLSRGAVELARGNNVAALPALRAANESFFDLGMPYETARTRVLLAAALRIAGDDDTAALELEAAQLLFTDLGVESDVVTSHRPGFPESEPDTYGLTTRELEVLRLLATGETNRGIAEQLVLSERTVDRHVSNIFTKLVVSTRTAAASFAYEQGLM